MSMSATDARYHEYDCIDAKLASYSLLMSNVLFKRTALHA